MPVWLSPYLPYLVGVLVVGVNQIIANNPKWPYNSLLTALLGLLTGMVPKASSQLPPKV